MKPLHTVALLAALSGLAGCDPLYGVRRSATIDAMPDLACVRQVLAQTAGIDSVQVSESEGSKTLSLTGIHPPTRSYSFTYQGQSPLIWGALDLTRDEDQVRFSQYLMTMHRSPDPAVVAATRPVMRQIEVALAQRCGLRQLPQAIQENCTKADCPSLE